MSILSSRWTANASASRNFGHISRTASSVSENSKNVYNALVVAERRERKRLRGPSPWRGR